MHIKASSNQKLPSAMLTLFSLTCLWLLPQLHAARCPPEKMPPLKFHLVRECQLAAADEALALESTSSLEECMELASELRGMAINYAPGGPKRSTNRFEPQPRDVLGRRTADGRQKEARKRLSVFEQPAEFFNCHVLQCPQNESFAGMVNDSRFDYYSVYGRPAALVNISCVPQVGLFIFNAQPQNYVNASRLCSNASEFSGSLAHVASEARTYSLARWLYAYSGQQLEEGIFLAYVGLSSLQPPDYRNAQQESLLCFLYSAWHVGHPRIGGAQENGSCVALTPKGSWQTLSCERELPFICEVLMPVGSRLDMQLDTGVNAAAVC